MQTSKQPTEQDSAVTKTALRIARSICNTSELADAHWQRALLEPLCEFLNRPGKEFRGRMVSTSWALAGGCPHAMPAELPLVLELLHAGSLIVDDIQDGSSWRRGAPSLHELCGMPVALNTGNWLYFAALSQLEELGLSEAVTFQLMRHLHSAVLRCHHGQGLDLTARVWRLDADEIVAVVSATTDLKTASLVELAASLGAIAAGGSPEVASALARFGRELGVALQMLDDIGGILSRDRRDKGYEDLRLGRPTWVWAWAASSLPRETLASLLARSAALESLDPTEGSDGQLRLESLRQELKSRVGARGRAEASARLRSAFRELGASLPSSPILGVLAQEIDRLEKSYG